MKQVSTECLYLSCGWQKQARVRAHPSEDLALVAKYQPYVKRRSIPCPRIGSVERSITK